MSKRALVGTIGFVLFVGIMCVAAATVWASDPALESRLTEQAAPALESQQASTGDKKAARFDQVAAVLSQSATGRRLLSTRETYRVDVQFEAESGSRFRKRENLILLDSNQDPVKAALFFAHEMHHARAFHEGEQARPGSETRQAYIEHKLQEEAQGMAISLQLKMELEQVDPNAASVTLPMEDYYRGAYQVAAGQARLLDSELSELQLEAIGRAAGEQALFKTFASGEIQTSNTYESYPDYYGQVWDDAHPIQAFMSNSPLINNLSNFAAHLRTALTSE